MASKKVFKRILLVLVLMLMVLPFITSFNDALTRAVMKLELYRAIEEIVVPAEIKMVTIILNTLGIHTVSSAKDISMASANGWLRARISWNCVGWQSMILLMITAITGLSRAYTKASKLEALTIGILGTVLLNIFRISLIYILLHYFGYTLAIRIFHDYFAIFITVGWLFFFWWFSYSYVLVRKSAVLPAKS